MHMQMSKGHATGSAIEHLDPLQQLRVNLPPHCSPVLIHEPVSLMHVPIGSSCNWVMLHISPIQHWSVPCLVQWFPNQAHLFSDKTTVYLN
jgi:hypothetical protein